MAKETFGGKGAGEVKEKQGQLRNRCAQGIGAVIWCAQNRVISHPEKFLNRAILRQNLLPKPLPAGSVSDLGTQYTGV